MANATPALYDRTGDYADAEPLYRRSLDIADRALADMLTAGSENDKRAAIANLEDPVPALISLQALMRHQNQRKIKMLPVPAPTAIRNFQAPAIVSW